jgi:hypothetical protein
MRGAIRAWQRVRREHVLFSDPCVLLGEGRNMSSLFFLINLSMTNGIDPLHFDPSFRTSVKSKI